MTGVPSFYPGVHSRSLVPCIGVWDKIIAFSMNSLVYTRLVIIDFFTCLCSFNDNPVSCHRSTYRSLFSLHSVSLVFLANRTCVLGGPSSLSA